ELRSTGFTVRAVGGRLHVGPKAKLTDVLRDRLRREREGLRAALLAETFVGPPAPSRAGRTWYEPSADDPLEDPFAEPQPQGEPAPYVTGPAATQAHFRDVLAGRAHWVFLTDSPDGHLGLVTAATAWAGRVRAGGLAYGVVDFSNAPTGHAARVSFLTVP